MKAAVNGDKSFAVIYRWSVDPEHEDSFRRSWRESTLLLKGQHGALGSCLSRAENGDFVAFARWPNEASRAEAFAAIPPVEPPRGIRSSEETRLWVEEDHLTNC